MTNEDSANSQLVSFGRNIKDTSSHIAINYLGLYPSRKFVQFYLKATYAIAGEKFEINDVQITGICTRYLKN